MNTTELDRTTGSDVVTRRRLLLGATAALGTSVLAACRTSQPPAGQGAPKQRAQPYTVRIQVWGDIQDRDVYDNIAADFNAEHTDITVENDHQAQGGPNYYDKFTTNVAAGAGPDLAYFQGWMWQAFAAQGVLAPVDSFIQRDKFTLPWPRAEDYDAQSKFRGKTYMSPSNTGTMVMYYIKGYFDQAGIPYPTADWTYADFQEIARRLTREFGGKQVYGYEWNGGYLRNTPWIRLDGELEWDRIVEPKQSKWDRPAAVQAYQWQLYETIHKLKISPSAAEQSSNAQGYRIQYGDTAMKVEGPWWLPRMWGPLAAREGGIPFDVQLLPRGRAAKTPHMHLIEGQCMTEQSKDKDAAWTLMRWIADDRGQRRIAEGGRMCNVLEFNRKYWLPMVTQAYNLGNAEAFLKAQELGTINLVGEITERDLTRETGLGDAINEIRDGKKSAKDAFEEVQPRIQQMLDAYWAKQGGK
jgi:ABC-type glycerol-3-phosphate transport system substrate-binding protein